MNWDNSWKYKLGTDSIAKFFPNYQNLYSLITKTELIDTGIFEDKRCRNLKFIKRGDEMANETTGTVKSIETETRERKDGKGTYTQVTLTTETGETFGGYDNQLPEGLKEGDSVSITYSTGTNSKTGQSFNKIISVNTQDKSQSKQKRSPVLVGTISNTFGGSSSGNYIKTFDNKGARVGGVLHDAVALTIHNSGGKPAKLEEVKKTAQRLLKLASELES